MYYTVYKTTNKINGKVYIGCHKTKNLDDGYLGSGKYLNRAIEKHGRDSFTKEILFVYDNVHDMKAKEAELVNQDFLAEENTYNLKLGGIGGFDYINSIEKMNSKGHSQETFEKISRTLAGRKLSPERVENIRKHMRDAHASGRANHEHLLYVKHSEETKLKISLSKRSKNTGQKNSQYGTMWITDGIVNRKIKVSDLIPDGWYKGRVLVDS